MIWSTLELKKYSNSNEDWEKIYEMDGGWENDDPDEYSIKANQIDYSEACAYYDKLRARKAWKKAHQYLS